MIIPPSNSGPGMQLISMLEILQVEVDLVYSLLKTLKPHLLVAIGFLVPITSTSNISNWCHLDLI